MLDPIKLRDLTGCGLSLCRQAMAYAVEHSGDDRMAIAYLKAKCFAVKTTCSFDERVQMFMKENEP
jgi:translation elongation factor EF-Ts